MFRKYSHPRDGQILGGKTCQRGWRRDCVLGSVPKTKRAFGSMNRRIIHAEATRSIPGRKRVIHMWLRYSLDFPLALSLDPCPQRIPIEINVLKLPSLATDGDSCLGALEVGATQAARESSAQPATASGNRVTSIR